MTRGFSLFTPLEINTDTGACTLLIRNVDCVLVYRYTGNNNCIPLFTNLCLAVEHCWIFCIGSCEPVHEDRTLFFVSRWQVNGWVCQVQRRNLVGLVEQNARGGLKRKAS